MRYGNDLLHGELIKLTPLTREDVAIFGPWYESVELQRFLNSNIVRPFSVEDEQEWYDNMRKQEGMINFAIRTLAETKLIGTCTVMHLNMHSRHCMLGISIGDTDAQGKGYGTDAMRVLLRYCFMELNLNRVALEVFSYNTRAIASYKKVGFQQDGVLREMILRDGEYHDMLVMSILRREWDALDNDKP